MNLSRADVERCLRDFIEGSGGPWDWDEFVSFPLSDPALEQVRLTALRVKDDFPATEKGEYCNSEGIAELRRLADELKRTS